MDIENENKKETNESTNGSSIIEGDEIASIGKEEGNFKDVAKVTVVIPYIHTNDDGFELKHCLRSIEKNLFDVDINIIVIGDIKPSWLNKENWVECDTNGLSARDSKLKKISIAISNIDVAERFILMSDDMYIVNPIMLADIEVLKADGILTDAKTVAAIDKQPHGNDIYNYETHTPCLFFKSALKKILSAFDEDDDDEDNYPNDFLIRSLYFNLLYKDFKPYILDWVSDDWKLPIASPNPDIDKIRKMLPGKKFLNHFDSAYSDNIKAILAKLFPDKSTLEIDDDISQDKI